MNSPKSLLTITLCSELLHGPDVRVSGYNCANSQAKREESEVFRHRVLNAFLLPALPRRPGFGVHVITVGLRLSQLDLGDTPAAALGYACVVRCVLSAFSLHEEYLTQLLKAMMVTTVL